ncbi:MAG TPA: serine hydrolase domain-containing protein [Candidatus Limiplasma sp.]|nr:serine hydrolase domain-containing protein [Candidatus Limiplasma sp.]HPS81656.1 serine hydrolase domain-containing protein [Candidatus Limiplasma sp.]
MNFDPLSRYLDSLSESYGIPAADCKVTLGYETVYRHSTGYADAAQTRPVAPTDMYYVYSCSKVMTVTAAMQLCEQGRLSLNDRLDRYLPEFAQMEIAADFPVGKQPVRWPTRKDRLVKAKNPIRILDLFCMTAGFSYDIESAEIQTLRQKSDNHATTREMMAAIARMPLLYEPGTRWLYSLAHDVLGAVIEVVSGETLGEYMQNHLFSPLEMEDIGFTVTPERKARLSAQYAGDPATQQIKPFPLENHYRFSDRYESGGAGILCTVDAYSRFVEAMSNGGVGANGKRILTMASIDELRKNRLDSRMTADFSGINKTGYGYGLGVRTLLDPSVSRSPAGEFGWDGAAGAYALIDTEHRLGIFYAEHVLSFEENYQSIHPTIRDLVYDALEE